MTPNPFYTLEQQWQNTRRSQAIKQQITVGGRLLCWHDYTCFGPTIRKHLLDWGFAHVCTKCGKSKVFKHMQIEPIPHQDR